MIPSSPVSLETPSWQRDLATAVTDRRELLRLLKLEHHPLATPSEAGAAARFTLRVPRYFVGLMRPGDPDDPLLAQVLPTPAEDQTVPDFLQDPVGDMAASLRHGVLKKYQGRALLITTGACAVHCRYCFRRHFPYPEQSLLRHWQSALATLHDLPEVSELILSGGDPLSLGDERLEQLIRAAEEIPHLPGQKARLHLWLQIDIRHRDQLIIGNTDGITDGGIPLLLKQQGKVWFSSLAFMIFPYDFWNCIFPKHGKMRLRKLPGFGKI